MNIGMKTVPIEPSKAEKHAREVDKLSEQCDTCKQYKPGNKHDGCEIRFKLVAQDSEVGWKNKHLFLANGLCKQYRAKVK